MAETEISQQYCVRWNSHLSSLSTAFPQLLDQEKFVDVTLACEGQQVHCHKVVLAACSQYFDNLLSENPCKHPIIILPSDIKLWTIQALVEFMYKGQVNVSQAGLPDLVKSGDLLQIRGLCNTDIASGLTVQNNGETESAQVSKVPSNVPPTAHMASLGKKELQTGSSVSSNVRRTSSSEEEQQIKTEEYDLDEEIDSDDPKHPEKSNNKTPLLDSTTITTVQTSSSSLGHIRVKPRENLFENYNATEETEIQQNRDECEVIQVTPNQCFNMKNGNDNDELIMLEDPSNVLPSLKYDRSVMEVKPIISGPAFSLMNIDEENFFNMDDDEDDYDMSEYFPQVSITMGTQNNSNDNLPRLMPKQMKPFASDEISPSILLRHPRGNQVRAYTEEELMTALNEIKAGLSIYKASQKYRVPRKTLRNWMKRCKIKSAHPMPIQLQRAAIKRKEERDQMLASITADNSKPMGNDGIIIVKSDDSY